MNIDIASVARIPTSALTVALPLTRRSIYLNAQQIPLHSPSRTYGNDLEKPQLSYLLLHPSLTCRIPALPLLHRDEDEGRGRPQSHPLLSGGHRRYGTRTVNSILRRRSSTMPQEILQYWFSSRTMCWLTTTTTTP